MNTTREAAGPPPLLGRMRSSLASGGAGCGLVRGLVQASLETPYTQRKLGRLIIDETPGPYGRVQGFGLAKTLRGRSVALSRELADLERLAEPDWRVSRRRWRPKQCLSAPKLSESAPRRSPK
jgi:hypothetical protein